MISEALQSRINKIILNSLHLPTARHKHFSFITQKKKITSFGYNQSFKSHPLAAKYGYRFNSIHSELHAILNFPYPVDRLKDFTLVNVRYSPTKGLMTFAKPCAMCLHFLSCLDLRSVLYTDENGEFVCLN